MTTLCDSEVLTADTLTVVIGTYTLNEIYDIQVYKPGVSFFHFPRYYI